MLTSCGCVLKMLEKRSDRQAELKVGVTERQSGVTRAD